jgi:pteridine reductase
MQERAVLVTGGARRIGAAIARALHAAGARVAIHCNRSRAEADALARELDSSRAGSCIVVQADLLDLAALPRLVEDAAKGLGRLDGLVNNASSFYATPFAKIGEREWQDLMGTNLRAPLFLAQAAASRLRETKGAIVNIIDIHAERPLPNFLVYTVAKSALAGLTRALAVELGPDVRVNGVAPARSCGRTRGSISIPTSATASSPPRRWNASAARRTWPAR